MTKEEKLQQIQIDLITSCLIDKKIVNPFTVFPLRKQLRKSCKNNKLASAYLEQLILEAEIQLQNILNFYPHISA